MMVDWYFMVFQYFHVRAYNKYKYSSIKIFMVKFKSFFLNRGYRRAGYFIHKTPQHKSIYLCTLGVHQHLKTFHRRSWPLARDDEGIHANKKKQV